MSEDTKIQWATHTFNPWEGCTKVSPGCLHCYAETRNHRFGMDNWGKGKPRRRTSAATWRNPVKWNKAAALIEQAHTSPGFGIRYEMERVFPSLCDPFDEEVPIEWLADFLKLIHDTPNLDWLLLSKRPENWEKRVFKAAADLGRRFTDQPYCAWLMRWIDGTPPHNVWIGVSVEDQKRADERIPELLKIPAAVRFLSVEPMLDAVRLSGKFYTHATGVPGCAERRFDWVIFGGESGPGARPCNIEWIRDGVRQCRDAGVPAFVKQLGSRAMQMFQAFRSEPYLTPMILSDKKGGDPSEWPQDLRVREFPVRALK